MKDMLHGLYVGPLAHLQGKTALLRPLERTQVLAQFDDTRATREPELLDAKPNLIWALSLGYGWHEFPAVHFKLLASDCVAGQRDYTIADWWDDLGDPHGNR